jgi:drug/metabolite transporter (DMT)-like permease
MNQKYQAVIYMLASSVAFTALNILVKYVDHLPSLEIVFFRSIGSVLCGILLIFRKQIPVFGNNHKILILRGLVGVSAMALFFKAVQLMPLSAAVSLRYLSPFFAAGIAVFYLKEKMKGIQWLFFVTAFIGVLILKGFDHRISTYALIVILTSALLSGIVYVIIRKIGKSEHPVVVVNYFMIIASLVGGVASILNWTPPLGIEWAVLFSMGIFGFVAQLYMTKALQIAEANIITPLKYSEVAFTMIAVWIIYGEHQPWISILGIAIIVFSLIANVMVRKGSGK